MDIEQNKRQLLNILANNLGLEEVKEGSYLDTVADGLYTATEVVIDEIERDILNLQVDTADEETLDVFGVHLGIPRLKDKFIVYRREAEEARIRVHLYKEEEIIAIPMFSRGDIIPLGDVDMLVTEDFTYDSSFPEDNYISAILQLNQNVPKNRVNLESSLIVPVEVSPLIREIVLEPVKPKQFLEEVEDIASYRKRLLALMQNRNVAGDTAVSATIRSSGADDFYIETDKPITTIYLFKNTIYEDVDERERFIRETVPTIRYKLNAIKPFGVNIDVREAQDVSVYFEVVTQDELIDEVPLYYYIDRLKQTHKIDFPFSIDKNFFNEVMTSMGFTTNPQLRIFLDYQGYREEVQEVFLQPGEYPSFLGINIVRS